MNEHAKNENSTETNSPEQIEFINKLKAGDEEAFKYLIESNQKKVYRTALSLVKNPTDAEDIAQEVFIRIYTSINGFKGNASLSTWIYKITYHLSLDYVKQQNRHLKRTKTLDDPEDAEILSISDDKFIPEEEYENKELRRDIAMAMKELPEEQRILVELKDIQGLSYEDIVEITGLKDGTMKSRLFRARESLRKSL